MRTHRNGDTKEALGGTRGVHVNERIVVNRSADEVYRFWRSFDNLARFMSHLESVRVIDAKRSHWVAKGPAGIPVEWDAEIIQDQPNRLISWRSLEDADVISAGSVWFERTPGGATEVRVNLQYEPPAGKLGAAVAKMLGEEPSQMIREDLQRLREILESAPGRTM
jgi:uncharacterized membrane protein